MTVVLGVFLIGAFLTHDPTPQVKDLPLIDPMDSKETMELIENFGGLDKEEQAELDLIWLDFSMEFEEGGRYYKKGEDA